MADICYCRAPQVEFLLIPCRELRLLTNQILEPIKNGGSQSLTKLAFTRMRRRHPSQISFANINRCPGTSSANFNDWD
jgi:hypothetical protein